MKLIIHLFSIFFLMLGIVLPAEANDPCDAVLLDFGHDLQDTLPCGGASYSIPNIALHNLGSSSYSLQEECGNLLAAPDNFIGWVTFVVRKGASTFEWQIIESGNDDIYYELYFSSDPNGPNECIDLRYYKCGDDFNSWEVVGVPVPSLATRYFVAMYSKVPDNNVQVDLMFRNGCGEACQDFDDFSVVASEDVCVNLGDSVQVSATLFDGDNQEILNHSNYAFYWTSSGGSFVNPNSDNPWFHPITSTKVYIQATGILGCPVYDSINIEVSGCCNVPPSILCPADTFLCPGDPYDSGITGSPQVTACDLYTLSHLDSIVNSVDCPGGRIVYRKWHVEYQDNSNLFDDCVQIISLIDNQPPEFTYCPSDLTIDAGINCYGIASWNEPTATDNCSEVTIRFSHEMDYHFPIGSTTVSISITDECNNSADHYFNVIVTKGNCCDQPPVMTCPPTFYFCPNCSTLPENTGYPTISGCSEYESDYTDSTVIDEACHKMIKRIWITKDKYNTNLRDTCFQILDLKDEVAPTLLGVPDDIVIAAGHNCLASNVYWDLPTASDNCSASTVTQSHLPSFNFPVGITEVTVTAVDDCGNDTSETFNVTVTSGNCCNEAPIINCPDDIIACPDGNTHTAVCGLATANGCSEYEITYADMIWIDEACNRVIKRTWKAIDKYDATLGDSCVQKIMLKDDTPPTLSGVPSDIYIAAGHNCLASNVFWDLPTAADNCGSAAVTQSHDPDFNFPIGITKVTVTAADACGNEVTKSFNVTVTSGNCCNEAPVITCPPDAITCPDDNAHATVCGVATAIGCSEYEITYSDLIWIDEACNKVIKRTWRAIDKYDSGLGDSCVQKIMLQDDAPPELIGVPSDIHIAAGYNCMASNVYWELPTATDNCGSPSVTQSHDPDFEFPIGITEVTVTAIDACGNEATESFNVTVTSGSCCNAAPVITCPQDVTGCPDGSTHSNVCGSATATGCSEYIISFSDLIWIDEYCNKIINRTWRAIDKYDSALGDSCVQKIMLKDDTPPTLSGVPNDIIIAAGYNCMASNVYWELPTATDNCGEPIVIQSHNPNFDFPVGVTEVTVTATDPCGNESSKSFYVTVTSGNCCNEAPVITCPADVLDCPEGNTHTNVCGTASVTGCSEYEITFSDQIWIDEYCNKVIKRTWRAIDKYDNLLGDSCVQKITLKDNTPPELYGVPEDLSFAAGHDCKASNVNWEMPTAMDDCGTPTVTQSHEPGFHFPIGNTVVTVTATDACGNKSTKTFKVIITQGNCCGGQPAINCPADVIACPESSSHTSECGTATVSGCSEYVITFRDKIWIDQNCHKVIKRTWIGIDKHNDLLGDSCVQSITLKDNTPPVISGVPNDINIGAGHNCLASNVYWDTPTAIDDCGNVTLTQSHQPSFEFPMGSTTVTITAKDGCDNKSTKSFKVIVTQGNCCGGAPQIVCPDNVFDCPEGSTHSDVCGLPTVNGCSEYKISYSDKIWVDEYCNKVIKRMWRAIDKNDPSMGDSCIQTITLKDEVPPVFQNCPDDINLTGCEAVCGWEIPTATDDCSEVQITSSHQPGQTFSAGTTWVTYTATDGCGNESTCKFKVVVAGEGLSFDCPEDMHVDGGAYGAYFSWDIPEVTTCCDCSNAGGNIEGFVYMGKHNGHHYYCSKYATNWYDAKKIAEGVGGNLAIIDDPQENKFIANNMCCDYALIGLSDEYNEGNFSWVNGQNASYTNWYPYQPNNKYGSQDVVEILRGDGRWNDAYTNCKKNFIVEVGCIDIVQVVGPKNGSKLACGKHEVVYKATDACGNEQTCSFNINVGCTQQVNNYCDSYGKNAQYMWIHNVQLGHGINNTSGSDWGYGDYTNISTDVQCGDNLPICLMPKFLNDIYNMHWKIWIDYNQDGDFSDKGELVGYGKCYKKLCGSLPISKYAKLGQTRLRVAMKYGGYPSNSCDVFSYGEVEDYSINIHCGNYFTNEEENHIRNEFGEAVELIEDENSIAFELPGDSQEDYQEIYENGLELSTEDNIEFNVFPNPANHEVSIDFTQVYGDVVNIELIDMTGRVWRSFVLHAAQVGQATKINVSDLPTGVYHIKARNDQGDFKVQKVIKQ